MRAITHLPVVKAVGFLAILLLCGLAQAQFLDGAALGYLFLTLAGIVAWLVIAPVPVVAVTHVNTLDVGRGLRRWFGLILLLIGLGCVVYATTVFHHQLLTERNPNDTPWFFFALGLGVALVGSLFLAGIGRLPALDWTVILLLAVLALALFVRVFQVDQYPFGVWFDEAIYGLNVRTWLADPNFRPIFVDNITYPHLLLDVLALQLWGVADVVGLRIVSAVLASLGVIPAYLIGRELRGRGFGLLMAFLLAALRWSIDFSRIGMVGADLVTFALLTFYAGLRLVRAGRLRDGLWFGVAFGTGFYGYSLYQLQMIALGVYLLLVYPFRRRPARQTVALGLTALLAAVVILMPLFIFIVDRSDDYFSRLNQVSIFNDDSFPKGTVVNAIVQSTIKHLGMFHFQGDRNGRHNLPGAPELDPVTGSLLVIGLFIALRERRREHLLFALSLFLALLAGILSVSFEAPQSLRAIGAILGVIYFAALGLEGMIRLAAAWLASLFRRPTPRAAYRAAGVGALAALALMAAWNFNIYFNLQRASLAVWTVYSTAESLTGRIYTHYGSTTQFFVSPLIANSPSVQFIAPNQIDRSQEMIMPDPFPLRLPPTAPAVLMVVPFEKIYMDYLHQLYPSARFQPVRPVDYGVEDNPNDTLFTVIDLSARDIGAVQGLKDGSGVLYAPLYDTYIFTFDPNVHLQVDEQVIASGAPVKLAEGNHSITLSPPDAALNWSNSRDQDPAPIPPQYFYHDPVTPNGLLATFYNTPDWQGEPVNKRILPFVYWFIQIIPMQRPYSVSYDGYLYAPATGSYQFALAAIDTGALDIDGVNLIRRTSGDKESFAEIMLNQGWHQIQVRHQDLTESSRIFLTWVTPGSDAYVAIPRDNFCPTVDRCSIPPSD